jgi:hypothetical protein
MGEICGLMKPLLLSPEPFSNFLKAEMESERSLLAATLVFFRS